MGNDTLLINQSMIKELVSMEEMTEIIDKTFKGIADGTVKNPTKVTLDLGDQEPYPPYEGFFNAMPAYIGWQDIAGIKWVSGFAGERKAAGLPFINGLIVLGDAHLGNFLAVMDGQFITNERTGAQTAVALSYLIKKPEITLSMFGTGTQARTNLRAIASIFDITHLTLWNHRRESAETFKEDMAGYVKGDIEIELDAQKACQSEVIVTATNAQEPIIKAEWVEPGTIVFPLSTHQEIENDLILKADKIIVDHIDQALHRGALKNLTDQGKLSPASIYANLGEVGLGTKELGDISNEIVICIPIGMGAVDVSVANVAYERAKERGWGETFDFQA